MPYPEGFENALRAKAHNPDWEPSDPDLRKSLRRIGSKKAGKMLAEATGEKVERSVTQRRARNRTK